jgi:hypothetical protein
MGWDEQTLTISALVSRHNSERDRRDDHLWEELQGRIRTIVNEEKYESISAMLHG